MIVRAIGFFFVIAVSSTTIGLFQPRMIAAAHRDASRQARRRRNRSRECDSATRGEIRKICRGKRS